MRKRIQLNEEEGTDDCDRENIRVRKREQVSEKREQVSEEEGTGE